MVLIRKNPLIELNVDGNSVKTVLDNSQIYAFDFDKTLYLPNENMVKFTFAIYEMNSDLIIKSAENLHDYSIKYLENLAGKKIDLNNKKYLKDLLVSDFASKKETNCGISRLIHFGYNYDEICREFARLEKIVFDCYKTFEKNPIMEKFLLEAYKNKTAIIWTDNSEGVTRIGMKLLGYPEEVYSNIPIVSMFKSINSDFINKISIKTDEDIVEDFCHMSSKLFSREIKSDEITMFDDNPIVIKNLKSHGVKNAVLVDLYSLETSDGLTDCKNFLKFL